MIIIQKFISFISPVFVLIVLELTVYIPMYFFLFIGLNVGIVIATLWRLAKSIRTQKFYGLVVAPLLFVISIMAMLVILEGVFWVQSIIIAGFCVYSIYLSHVFAYLYQQPSYQPYSLENISMYMNILTAFFCFVLMFSLQSFLSIRSWQLVLPAIVVFLILIVQTFWIHHIRIFRSKKTIAMIVIILLESFWAAHFLSMSYYANALLLTLIFYIIMNISRMYLTNMLTKRSIKRQCFLVCVIFITTLSSSKWL